MSMNSRIEINPLICHGKPVIRGTRVMVATILGALAAGDSKESILQDYPGIDSGDLDAALQFACELSAYQSATYDEAA